MDLIARFNAYAGDFERSYGDGDWARLGPYFAEDAVYECPAPEALAFRVEGRAAILERFRTVTEAFDRRFDSRSLHYDPPRAAGSRVSINGVVVYTVTGAPPLHLPFSEEAEYRGAEIVRLVDSADAEAVGAVAEWLAQHSDRLRG